jgi:dihydrofolate synthase/folylpolyglutamate synthase
MNFDRTLSYLLSLGHETLTMKLGLENTEKLLAALDHPQHSYRSVQIAGTNGKGSTAAFLDSICRAAGIRTGLFTSPHLISITERIRVNGESISENQFGLLTGTVKDASEQLVARGELPTLPTFFEHITAIGLLAFAEAKVDLAILETGLGGRLDSTTAVNAGVVAITPVDMDHQEYLGHTLAEIAAEKAAIIQPGAIAIVAPQKEPALKVILRRCEAVGVQPRFIARFTEGAEATKITASTACVINVDGMTSDGRAIVSFTTPAASYDNVTLALRGRHQVDNAATAVSLAEAISEKGFQISSPAIINGIQTATHAGRLELWEGPPRFLFDGAHNPAAVRALRAYLDEFVSGPVTIIFGAMRDKALNEMIGILFPRADKVILTTLDNPRAASIDDLLTATPASFDKSKIATAPNIAEALTIAREVTPSSGIVCITGSLHLIGKAQELLQP